MQPQTGTRQRPNEQAPSKSGTEQEKGKITKREDPIFREEFYRHLNENNLNHLINYGSEKYLERKGDKEDLHSSIKSGLNIPDKYEIKVIPAKDGSGFRHLPNSNFASQTDSILYISVNDNSSKQETKLIYNFNSGILTNLERKAISRDSVPKMLAKILDPTPSQKEKAQVEKSSATEHGNINLNDDQKKQLLELLTTSSDSLGYNRLHKDNFSTPDERKQTLEKLKDILGLKGNYISRLETGSTQRHPAACVDLIEVKTGKHIELNIDGGDWFEGIPTSVTGVINPPLSTTSPEFLRFRAVAALGLPDSTLCIARGNDILLDGKIRHDLTDQEKSKDGVLKVTLTATTTKQVYGSVYFDNLSGAILKVDDKSKNNK